MNGEIKQYSLEWYKEMRKLNKDTIISLVESNGKQRDTLKEQITNLQSELKAADSVNEKYQQALHGIYNLCDNDNDTHEHIWHIANEVLH